MEQKRKKRKKLNNTGSTIISVIIVVAFVSILATTLLYVSGRNYYMKITDQKTKASFYEAETALEEIKAVLNADAADAAYRAYLDVLYSYSSMDANSRNIKYEQKFFDYLIENWDKHKDDPAGPLTYEQAIKGLVESQYQTAISLDSVTYPSAGSIEREGSGKRAFLYGIQIKYTDSNGYYSEITTNYCIIAPYINLSVDGWKDTYTTGESMKKRKFDLTKCVDYCDWTKK